MDDTNEGTDLLDLIADHPFTEGFGQEHLDALAAIATRVDVAGGGALFRTGEPADALYLVLAGQVTLEIEQGPGAIHILETLGPGDTLGWSWLYEPYRWRLDAYVTELLRAVMIDAAPLRKLLDDDAVLGRAVAHRVGRIVVDRLHRARHELATARDRR